MRSRTLRACILVVPMLAACGESDVCDYVPPGRACGTQEADGCNVDGVTCWCGYCIPEECSGELSELIIDHELEHGIRYLANRPTGSLRYEHVWQIEVAPFGTDSWNFDGGKSNLEGMQCLTALEELDLTNNENIDDLSPLHRLYYLVKLNLTWSIGPDISTLAGVTRLRELNLEWNGIEDIEPLAGLTELQRLYLADNKISDVSPLAGLTALQQLDLNHSDVADLSPLAELGLLEELVLSPRSVSDISSLAGMHQMERLVISPSQVEDIRVLAGMPLLEHLDLYSSHVQDLSPLSGLVFLTFLDLTGNEVRDVTPLVNNPGLGEGDTVVLFDNFMDCAEQAANLQALRDRGVEVYSDCD